MTMDEKIKTLRENVEIVGIHLEHIERVLLILNPFFPFTAEKIEQLTFDEIDRCDALIYRFTHVQDTLSGKVFTLFLDVAHEQPEGPGFIDKLNLLERLEYIESAYQWKDLRDLRNHFSHEYANRAALQAKYLNQLRQSIPVFTSTFDRIKKRLAESDESN